MIKASNLWFSYPGDPEPVLRDISFAVDQGEAVALVGGCGAGKSTLLLHLNGTLTAERGHLQVAGPTRDILDNETLMLAHGLEKPHSLRHPHPHNQENQP